MERRSETPISLMLISPMIAVALTMISAAIMFALLGKDPVAALSTYFLDPLSDSWGLQEVAVKATPLVLIAVGLAVCYRAKVWNIGAEGQFLFGAMAGGYIAIITHGSTQGPWLLPVMLLVGAMAGACFALIPALLRTRFGANEILTSLMLVYVAELLLDYLVRGPWRDPAGFNMPNSVVFEAEATLPLLMAGGRLNIGTPIMIAIVLGFMLLMGRTLKGFEIRLVGEAPRAARFAGFSETRLIITVFMISGALAGLAGVLEAAGTVKQLQPGISPGYGFTAIIVAFLGRLNPIGCLFAGIFIAITFIGGENAQIMLRLPLDATRVLQGLLLFFVLVCDSMLLYRFRLLRGAAA